MTRSLSGRSRAKTRPDAGARGGPVVVVGAGPYGLSVAAHLRAAGVGVRVFGEVMGSWRHAVATGMFLKSTPAATDLSAPVSGGRLADFCRAAGEPELTELTPIPCETFVRYGMWFTQRYVGAVEAARVTAVERSGASFVVRLEGGGEIEAAAVVVATGLATFAYVPDELLPLAPGGPGPQEALSTRASTPTCPGTRGGGWRWSGAASRHWRVPRCCTRPVPISRCWCAMPGCSGECAPWCSGRGGSGSLPRRLRWGRAGRSPQSAVLRAPYDGCRPPPGCSCFAARWVLRAGGGCASVCKAWCPFVRRAVWSGRVGPGPRCTCVSGARAVARPIASSAMCWRPPGTGSMWMPCPS